MRTFVFMSTATTKVSATTYRPESFRIYALTPDDALERATSLFTPGFGLFCWYEEDDTRCNVCLGPFHPATGHQVSDKMVWCGVCTRKWVQELKGHLNRRWGKARFYDHATVPTGDTSALDAVYNDIDLQVERMRTDKAKEATRALFDRTEW